MLSRTLLSSFARRSSSSSSASSAAPLRSILSYRTRCLAPPSCRTLSTLPNLPLFRALQNHDLSSTAVVHSVSGRSFTYGNLIGDVLRSKEALSAKADGVEGERIAFLAENGYDYVGTVFSCAVFRYHYCYDVSICIDRYGC